MKLALAGIFRQVFLRGRIRYKRISERSDVRKSCRTFQIPNLGDKPLQCPQNVCH
jgi:hypothetical protein